MGLPIRTNWRICSVNMTVLREMPGEFKVNVGPFNRARVDFELGDLGKLSVEEAARVVSEGIPAKMAKEFARKVEITVEELAELLRSTPRTLSRRFLDGRLEGHESERLWELARLFDQAVEVFESPERAVQWLRSPIAALRYQTPLEYARTTPGIRELEKVLGRIEHGLFA